MGLLAIESQIMKYCCWLLLDVEQFFKERMMEICINTDQIRELDEDRLSMVSGGFNFGTGPGGIFSPKNLGAAGRFAGGVGLLYTSFRVGWDIGSYGYTAWSRYKYNSR